MHFLIFLLIFTEQTPPVDLARTRDLERRAELAARVGADLVAAGEPSLTYSDKMQQLCLSNLSIFGDRNAAVLCDFEQTYF